MESRPVGRMVNADLFDRANHTFQTEPSQEEDKEDSRIVPDSPKSCFELPYVNQKMKTLTSIKLLDDMQQRGELS